MKLYLAALMILMPVATGAAAPATIHWVAPVCPGLAMSGDVVVQSGGALSGTISVNGKIVGDDKGQAHSVSFSKQKAPGCGGKDAYLVVVKGSFLQSGVSHVDEVDLIFSTLSAAESAKRTIQCTAFHVGCRP